MKAPRGMTFIDVVVGTSLVLIIFLGLFGILRASVMLASLAKARTAATAIADNQIEAIRALTYDSVGTIGGIPAGTLSATSTTSVNGITYSIRTFIEYVDDPADGSGAADTNTITTDYKRVKVAVTYTIRGILHEVDEISNEAPSGMETTTGGGTLKVSVVNAAGAAVAGATVQVVNASTTPTVNLSTFSDSTGSVILPGAATSTQYQITVSKTGYSSAQTYVRDSTNQNPSPGYLTVVKNQTTTGTFAIDLLSALTLRTFTPIAASSTVDTFADATQLASQTSTAVSGGAVKLLLGGGTTGYALSGNTVSVGRAPAYLSSWTAASSSVSLPAGTTVRLHVTDGTSALIPDSALPGNAVGFTSYPVNLSSVSTSTYPTLGLSADLTTNATTTTPSLLDWTIAYMAGPVPVPNVSFSLTGLKTIGTTGGGAPIYKTTVASTTSALGLRTLPLEWDTYALTLSGYDVIDACAPLPYALSPGISYNNALYLGTLSTNAVLVSVRDNAGTAVPGASVTVSRSGFTQTVTTSSCGTAYFGSLTSSSGYTIQAVKSGYTTATYTGITISGHLFYAATFP